MSTQGTVRIGEKQWTVSVVTTPSELSQGLSGVASIPPYTGMLFDLGSERIVTVNAYEMLFPLSIVFIDEDLKVTEVANILAPGDDSTTSLPCRYFLETSVGEVASIQQGDQVVITGYTPTTTSSLIELVMTAMIVAMMMQMIVKTIKEVK